MNIIKVLSMRRLSFCFGNRLSYALSKYTNFPDLFRREKRSFSYYISHPYEIFLFFENIDEYYQGSNNALSTVFVLVTDFIMPFQNILISRLSYSKKRDHFSFVSQDYKIFLFLENICENYQGSSNAQTQFLFW